ncbi:MAG: ATP-binding cassette domain-containing protein [Candidatus Rokuibacteriota bacterium]
MATVPQSTRVEARRLSLSYGDVVALRELSADVTGRVIGVLGATASGKTSLLQVIAGLRAASDGELRIDGEPVRVGKRREVAYVPQDTGAFPFFQRPKETMSLGLALRGIPASDYPEQFLEALGLGEDDRSAAGYSAGMKQKVRIAYAMVHTPRLLLLDEPMTGLDIRERFRVLRLLDRLRSLTTIVFSTHHPEEAAAICDEILILGRGRAVASGRPAEITSQAAGHVFEVSLRLQDLPEEKTWDIVAAERDGDHVHLRVVGTAPPGARPAPPRLTDAYVLLTSLSDTRPT